MVVGREIASLWESAMVRKEIICEDQRDEAVPREEKDCFTLDGFSRVKQ